MRTYNELKQAMSNHGYRFFLSQFSLNFIWERTSYHATNVFDDWCHIAYIDNKGNECLLSLPATTKPGIKGSLDSPIKVNGVIGTAIIKCGQYLSSWEFRDSFSEFSTYPYFRQIGKIDYWRDGNKDHEIDKIQPQEDKLFGTHWHRMSQIGTYGSGQVNNWSLGCMGCPQLEWLKLLPLVRKSVVIYGSKFTGTIIDSKDI